MTQDDYKLIAGVFKSAGNKADDNYMINGAWEAAYNLADDLEEKYPDFDRDAFLKDCGIA